MMDSLLAIISPRRSTQASSVASPAVPNSAKQKIKAKSSTRRERKKIRRALTRQSTAPFDKTDEDDTTVSIRGFPDHSDTSGGYVTPDEDMATPTTTVPERTKHDMSIARLTNPTSPAGFSARKKTSNKMDISHIAQDGPFEEEKEEEDESDDEEFAFKRFTNYRWDGNSIEVEVEWEHGIPTWEPEANLHRDAPQALFDYWRGQGGRPLNPEDPNMYEIFAIRKHSKNKKRFLIEWVGYDKKDMTWLSRSVVEDTAKEVLEDYWKSLEKTE